LVQREHPRQADVLALLDASDRLMASLPEATSLYRSGGYIECGPFPPYAPDPLSVFMTRRLLDDPTRPAMTA
jgi:hypothetical protein